MLGWAYWISRSFTFTNFIMNMCWRSMAKEQGCSSPILTVCALTYEQMTYSDMKGNLAEYDTSDYPTDHPLHNTTNAKVIGKFKDETNSVPPVEFVGLRSKMYSLQDCYSLKIRRRKPLKVLNGPSCLNIFGTINMWNVWSIKKWQVPNFIIFCVVSKSCIQQNSPKLLFRHTMIRDIW